MKYFVKYRFEACYTAEVEADNLEEARKKAEEAYINADFGQAEDIDGEAVAVEDETGNFVWER